MAPRKNAWRAGIHRLALAGTTVAVLSTSVVLITTAQPSSAVTSRAATTTSCSTTSGKATFSPGLPPIGNSSKVTPTVKIAGPIGGCIGGGVTSGTASAVVKFTQPVNCTTLAGGAAIGATGKETITWNTKKTSTVTLSLTGVPGSATEASITGKVTGGLFAGSEESGSVDLTPAAGACTKSALTLATFSGGVVFGPSSAPPVFTSATSASLTEGTPASFAVSVKAATPTYFAWGGKLPTGTVLFDGHNGRTLLLEGTPAVGSAGTYHVTIAGVDATGGHAMQSLTITVAPISATVPVVQGISPSTSGTTDVTITGSNLSGATAVDFGATPSPSFAVLGGGSSINAMVPQGVNGGVDVTVIGPGGTSPVSLNDRFTYRVAPQAPIITSVAPVGLGIAVSWTQRDSSDQATGYTLTGVVAPGFPGTVPAGCSTVASVHVAAPLMSTKLPTLAACPGVPYTVTVTATNQFGTGLASQPSLPIVPLDPQPPTAPLLTSVLARPGALLALWSPPTQDGGEPITSYRLTVTPSKGSAKTFTASGTATSLEVSGLTDGVSYSVAIAATSKAGTSAPSAQAMSGTPSATNKPGAPSGLQVMPTGTGSIVVSWQAPADTGSKPLTAYELSYGIQGHKGVKTVKLNQSSTSHVFSTLVQSDFYTFSVSAVSAAGKGPSIDSSVPVTPTITRNSQTVVLSSKVMSGLLGVSADSSGDGHLYTWQSAEPQVAALAPGSIIEGGGTASAPAGVLAVVQTVSTDGAGDLVVDATPALAAQAFRTASFSYSGTPTGGLDLTARVGGRSRGVQPVTNGGDPCWSPGSPFTAGSQVCVTPNVQASASVYCSVWWTVPIFNFQICHGWALNAAVTGTVTATENLTATWSGSSTTSIYSMSFACIPTPIGCIQISIDVNFLLSGSVNIASNASGSYTGTLSYNSSGFHSSGTATYSSNGPLITGSATGTATLQAIAKACIDWMLCGALTLDGSLTATFMSSGTPYFSLCPSVSIAATMTVNYLISSASFNATIYSHNFTCFTIQNGPVTLAITPGNPTVPIGTSVQTFAATRSDGHAPSNNWSLVDASNCDSITSGGVLTTCFPTYNTPFQVKDFDANSSPAPVNDPVTTNVNVNTTCAFSPPQALGVTVTSSTVISYFPLRLRPAFGYLGWTAPVNTGGTGPSCNASIVGYLWTIYDPFSPTPQTYFTTTSTTPPIDFGASSGPYLLSVEAVNNDGGVSPAATTSFYEVMP